MLSKPDWVFDRDSQWRHLSAFAARGDLGRPELGVVGGRRRQGKTFLLQALTEAAGGMYFGATQATAADSLRQFADAVARYAGLGAPPRLADWDEAIRFLFANEWGEPRLAIFDEFPYLAAAAPELPSVLQREIDRSVTVRRDLKLLLCGSAMSVMGGMLGGTAPLRGRASLELIIRPFPYLDAARYWGVTDPALAIKLHAVVGGTPAYRSLIRGDSPDSVADFDDWVLRTVLDPATPLFREARYLLEEESGIRDSALYHSTLAAVAEGHQTRGAIANYIGRKAADIGHHLNVLEDCGLLRRDPDLFRSGRSFYRVAEPLIVFYQIVMRPQWGQLETGRAAAVWRDARQRFSAQVLGPHFEELCRHYAVAAPPSVFGVLPGEVGSGVVGDSAGRTSIQVDVVVLEPAAPGASRRVLSLGEAKYGEVMGIKHLERLRRARELLARRGYDTREVVLACYSGAGFSRELLGIDDPQLRLIGPDELYSVAE
jgi:AAA+ ATPase superfamily predicted ATPase